MSAQSSLKARARAILGRTTKRTIPAQYGKKAAHYPHIAQRIGNLQSTDIEKIKAWLNQIGEPEEDHYLVLDKCKRDSEALKYYLEQANEYERDKRRKKVLSMLADNPDCNRAYVTNADTDQDNVIVTVAIRDVASFELQIPKINYDPFAFAKAIDEGSLH